VIPDANTSAMSYRLGNFLGLVACAGALGLALLYLQDRPGMETCPLCTLTRIILLVMALLFAIGWILNPKPWLQRLLAGLNLLLALGGLATSARHIWLDTTTGADCPQGITPAEPLSAMQSLGDTLRGVGHCPGQDWSLPGVPLAYLTLVLFAALVVLTWKQVRKQSRRNYFN